MRVNICFKVLSRLKKKLILQSYYIFSLDMERNPAGNPSLSSEIFKENFPALHNVMTRGESLGYMMGGGDHDRWNSYASQSSIGDHDRWNSYASQSSIGDHDRWNSYASQSSIGDHDRWNSYASQSSIGSVTDNEPVSGYTDHAGEKDTGSSGYSPVRGDYTEYQKVSITFHYDYN